MATTTLLSPMLSSHANKYTHFNNGKTQLNRIASGDTARFMRESMRDTRSTSEPLLLSYPFLPQPTPSIPQSQSIYKSSCSKSCFDLMKLPPELRRQIWKYVLGGHSFHLWMERDHLRGVDCEWPDFTTCNIWCHQGALVKMVDEQKIAGKRQLLAFLLTCKQIYSEAIGYLYSS
ncbi:hypothetical protein F5884DRAFT_793032, partial [Xylogone sp. PMI_703]